MREDRSEQAEALRTAIDTEKAGYRLYMRAAKKTSDPAGKAAFEQLANDEMDHIRVLTAVYSSVGGGEPWMTYREALESLGPTPPGEIIFPEDEAPGSKPLSDVEALRKALAFEEKSVEYYAARLAGAREEKARSFYGSLVQMEEGHVKIVRAEIDSLTGTGFWLDYREISLED